MPIDSYYEPLAEPGHYRATAATAGPWDERTQHGGPPTALLATVIEDCEPVAGLRLARITVELLAPIPVSELSVRARVLRPGRRVRLLEATLEVEDRPLALARVWQIATQPDLLPPPESPLPPPVPEQRPLPPLPGAFLDGYVASVDWRFVRGSFGVPGPAELWARPLIPLFPDRPLTGLQRVLVIADSANGISAELPFSDWLFVPTALTVTLHRHPTGDWVFMRAKTSLATDGLGSCHADLADAEGFIGTASQPLVIARR